MPGKETSSKPSSLLVSLFLQRSGTHSPTASPERVICELVEKHRRKRARTRAREIQQFLQDRNITSIEMVPDLKCDGTLEPTGMRYEDGFRMLLKKNVPQVRLRFTMAHEICHTFFYELVPEIKFRPNTTDESEERLCNVGAAAILINERSLRRQAKKMQSTLESLEDLAAAYEVSLSTMLLRLRSLQLWDCQLSHWHRTVDGVFVLDRLHGGRKLDWAWKDASILQRVWETKRPEFGREYVTYDDADGVTWFRRVSYQLRPSSSGVTALWGRQVKTDKSILPLFNPHARRSVRDQR